MPHGYCFAWNPALLSLHVVSDGLIGLAYFSIPIVLWLFVRRRTDVPFSGLFVMFGVFIIACGLTHFMAILTVWKPLYWLDGAIKAVTALASVGTACVLIPIIPKALALRSPAELAGLNDELERLLDQKNTLIAAYEREHKVATTLQRALLPQELPLVGGLELTTAYRAAAEDAEIGGDWFDAFALSERLLCLSCGDVTGHGLRAASLMGSVRQMVRTAAREDEDPAVVLGRVNRSLCHEDGGVVTAFYGVLDLDTGVMRYALAGHPGPVVASANEAVLLHGSGIVLGVDADAAFERYRFTLSAGALLVLYTDGLIEVERNVIKGIDDLRVAAIEEASSPTANAAESIQGRVFATVSPRDDAATMCVRVNALGADARSRHYRSWRVDASDGARGTRLRSAVVQYLNEYGTADSAMSDAELVVGELIANVASHTEGHARFEVEWRNGVAVLSVESGGLPYEIPVAVAEDVWRESGRGLRIIAAVAPDVRVERDGASNRLCVTLPVSLA